MTDYQMERAEVETIKAEVRNRLDVLMDGAAQLSEFTVDAPLGLEARPPLTESQREVTVALSALAVLLDRRASEASTAREPRWEGLADAVTYVNNVTGMLGLPQIGALVTSPEDDG